MQETGFWFTFFTLTSWFRSAVASLCMSAVMRDVPRMTLLSEASDWWMLWTNRMPLNCSSWTNERTGEPAPSLGRATFWWINEEPWDKTERINARANQRAAGINNQSEPRLSPEGHAHRTFNAYCTQYGWRKLSVVVWLAFHNFQEWGCTGLNLCARK